MSDLRKLYVELLKNQGIENPLYRLEKLKVRLQRTYQTRIAFWHPRHRSEAEIVYCDEVPKGQMVECIVSNENISKNETPGIMYRQDENRVYHAAKLVRAALLTQESTVS